MKKGIIVRRKPEQLALATKAIHGRQILPVKGPVSPPIYQTSTYRFHDSGDAIRYAEGDPGVFVYTRYHNPTVREAEERLALMMGSEKALLFSSGMAAISTTVHSVVRTGEEIISAPALYGGTYRFFRDTLPGHGITVRYLDPRHPEGIARLLNEQTRLVYFETPTNPTLDIVDIRRIVAETRRAARGRRRAPIVMIDNTFATVVNQNPLSLGVDAVVESGTKYLGGHSDLMAGVLAGSGRLIRRVHDGLKHYGGCADPFAAYLLLRSLKTFELRVHRQNENAFQLVKFLRRHPKVSRVLYPGLPSHPGHQVARKQMRGFGGMVTVEVDGGARAAVRVVNALRIALNAMSLGGVETLVSIPVYSSHINMDSAELRRHGVTPGMIRISVGIEDIRDLKEDFTQALGRLEKPRRR